MKRTINVSEFRDAFHNMGRGEQFSYEGLGALYNYLEDYEDQTDTESELDVISLCCDFTEYENFEELQKEYDVEDMDELQDNTSVIPVTSDSFIIQCY